MTDTHSPIPIATPDDLNELIVRYLEGRADEAEVAMLNAELQSNVQLRRRFVAISTHERCLSQMLTVEATRAAGRPASPTLRPLAPVASGWCLAGYAIAAMLVLGGIAAAITLIVLANGEPASSDPVASDPTPVATLTDASDDLMWSIEPLNPGDELPRRTIQMESGSAELLLTSGTQVNLTGAAQLRLDSPMQVAMAHGTATFTCPRDARGFTVTLPGGARVVDLGTRFVIAVEGPGRVVVQVLEGTIRYEPADGAPQLLTGDQAISVVDGRSEPLAVRDPRRPWRGPAYTYTYSSVIQPAPEAERSDANRTKLTDGKTGQPTLDDPTWVGFNDGVSLTPVDNGEPQPAIDVTFADSASLRTLVLTYMVRPSVAVYPPYRVLVRFSDDGLAWSEPIEFPIGAVPSDAGADPALSEVRTAAIQLGDARAMRVRVEVYSAYQWVYLSEMSFEESPATATTPAPAAQPPATQPPAAQPPAAQPPAAQPPAAKP